MTAADVVPFARVGVIGAGAWGTAIALAALRAGRDTVLWARNADAVEAMRRERENARYLPGVPLAARSGDHRRSGGGGRRRRDHAGDAGAASADGLHQPRPSAAARHAGRAVRQGDRACDGLPDERSGGGVPARLAHRRAVRPDLRGGGRQGPADGGHARDQGSGTGRQDCRNSRQPVVPARICPTMSRALRSGARSRTCWRSPAASSWAADSATMPVRR